MKLYLIGHDYKYAAEQIMLMLFPDERPEYPEGKQETGDSWAVIALSSGKIYTTATTKIYFGGKTAFAASRVKTDTLKGKLVADRLLQKIIKLSFYKAAVAVKGEKPVWGALTGIRPGKIATKLMVSGASPEKAQRVLVREYFVSPERAAFCTDTAKAGMSVKNALLPLDICLYVGIPFCPTRCAYCSFVSHSVEKSIKLIEPFLAVLYREIEETAKVARELGLRVVSVYFGGGTPTTLSADELFKLMSHLQNAFDLSQVREYTVEAGRPDTISAEKLRAIKAGGATRISINPQTTSDKVLEAIGRRHTAEDFRRAFGIARGENAGLINTDLIAGLPADTVDGFYRTLDEVLCLRPENITVHTLSLKKGSRITTEGTDIPGEKAVSQMLDYAAKMLREEGYTPYYLYRQKFMSGGFENIGWCREGCESLYNICIMEELCTILALGGGGSTKLVAPKTGKIERVFNAKYPLEYIENAGKIVINKEKIRTFYEKEAF
ncbi:MAG: coproporphyrinogen dehydrogenase HemZ [Oscillospiraceae bacterium]